MATEVSAQMGSGTIPFTKGILHTSLGGTLSVTLQTGPSDGRGIRRGTQVMVANPEDLVASAAFRCSGINVGTSPVKILDQNLRDNLIKMSTKLKIQNLGTGDLYIGNTSAVSTSIGGTEPGWKLIAPSTNFPPQVLIIDLLASVEVWAVASASTDVRMIAL